MQESAEAFEKRTLEVYAKLLGSAKQAQVEFNKAKQLASLTEFRLTGVSKVQHLLLAAGVRGIDIEQGMEASTDIAASQPPEQRAEALEKTGTTLAYIYASGKLHERELASFSEMGIKVDTVLKHLNLGSSTVAIRAVRSGKVGSKEGVAAIYRAILTELETKRLGEFSMSATNRARWHAIARRRATVDVSTLWAAYADNAVAADSVYKNKPLLITGIIDSIDAEPNGNPVLSLRTPNRFQPVVAKIRATATGWAANLSRGSHVSLNCAMCYGRVAGSVLFGLCEPDEQP